MLNISSTIYIYIYIILNYVEYIAIEIVDSPSYKLVIFHSYVSLPEGKIPFNLVGYIHPMGYFMRIFHGIING